ASQVGKHAGTVCQVTPPAGQISEAGYADPVFDCRTAFDVRWREHVHAEAASCEAIGEVTQKDRGAVVLAARVARRQHQDFEGAWCRHDLAFVPPEAARVPISA